MNKPLYEKDYQKTGHFSFGENWRDFLKFLTPEKIKISQESLEKFLGDKNNLKSKTFIDLGCGSGIFSLAALRLGVKTVTSVDVDQNSIKCTEFLNNKEGEPKNWSIKKGSVLDIKFLKNLGKFDIVYSWGVLHHTGEMYQAIKNASTIVNETGELYIAIYNNYDGFLHGKSTFWLKIKSQYNSGGPLKKKFYFWVYSIYLFLGLCFSLKNPFRYIRNYQSARGMSFKHDVIDWLGGYPYEFAKPAEIVSFLSNLGFTLKNIRVVNSIGCNEYLFTKNKPLKSLPKTTVLISVYNGGKILDKTLKSVVNQTIKPDILCVNDGSRDNTAQILKVWQVKLKSKLKIITNSSNLGLTKSLNIGLKHIKAPYAARIDAGDWWEKNKLEKQINFLESNSDYGVVGSWYVNHDKKINQFISPHITDQLIRQHLIYQNTFAHSSIVFKTKIVHDLGGYDQTVLYGQDYELWLRLLPETKFFNLPQYLCHRAIGHGISIEKQHEQMLYAMKTRAKYIKTYHMPLRTYASLIEPLLVSLIPRPIADLKRKINNR